MDSQGYDVAKIQDDDHASLVLYHKMLRYTIAPRPRKVLKAVGFKCPPRHALGVAQLEQAIRRGNHLSPYRSKSIADLTESDGLLDYWGIHHLHLGTTQRKDGFIARTKELLFCFVDDTFAYFIKVAAHNSSPWAKQELIETIHLNWPTAIEPFRLHNVVAVSPEFDDADLKALRQANLVSLLTMQDGTVYREPCLGNTTWRSSYQRFALGQCRVQHGQSSRRAHP